VIHSASSNGSGDLVLTSGGVDLQPMLSPDRKSIAFVRDSSKVVVMNADGTNQRTVATAKGISTVRWSPDGTMLAFAAIDDRDTNLKVVKVDGTGERTLGLMFSNGNTYDRPSWSPDSKSLAYARVVNGGAGPNPWSLHVVQLDGSDRTLLSAPAGHAPMWSPVGTLIVSGVQTPEGAVDLFTVDSASGQAVQVTHKGAQFPVWSPDGTKIAYTVFKDGTPRLVVANRDGSSPVVIADDVIWYPTWSPDGALVLAAFRNGETRAYPFGGGSPVVTIAKAQWPSWQP
jgi:Tol biopolymer transport system component